MIVNDRISRGKRLYDLKKKAYVFPPGIGVVNALDNGTMAVKKDKMMAIGQIDGQLLTGFHYRRIFSVAGNPYFVAKDENDRYTILDDTGVQHITQDFDFADLGISLIGQDTTYYFSVSNRNDGKDSSRLIDIDGQTLLELPDGYQYESLDGPLDQLVPNDPTSTKQRHLVQDLTTKFLSEGYPPWVYYPKVHRIKGLFYYEIRLEDAVLIYDGKGKEIIRSHKSSMMTRLLHSRNAQQQEHLIVLRSTLSELYEVYDLDGKRIVTEAEYHGKNNFGQFHFTSDNKIYLID